MTADDFFTQQAGQLLDQLFLNLELQDREAAHRDLLRLVRLGVSTDLVHRALTLLSNQLRIHPDRARVLAWFVDFVSVARNPQSLLALLLSDGPCFIGITTLVTASPQMGRFLSDDFDAFELLRLTQGQPVAREVLIDEIQAECRRVESLQHAQTLLQRHHRRELLRIAYGDVVGGTPVERTCQQLTDLADAIVGAALETAVRLSASRRGFPDIQGHAGPAGDSTPEISVLAHGAYGGRDLGYDNELDVVVICRPAAHRPLVEDDDHRIIAKQWIEAMLTILRGADLTGSMYECRLRLNVSNTEEWLIDADDVLRSLDRSGRTWQRQTLVKARFAAGSEALASQWIQRLEPWIYRRYLATADLEGMRAAKRKLSRHRGESTVSPERGNPDLDPFQSSREIEQVTQFLQLLNGADLPQLREGSTFQTIIALEQVGCLTMSERGLLSEHYAALRSVGHRLRLATITTGQPTLAATEFLTASEESEANRAAVDPWVLAAYAQPVDIDHSASAVALRDDVIQRRRICRRIVDHLVHDVFPEADEIPYETEMVLDPDVDLQAVEENLQGYGFERPDVAFQNLLSMATEPIRFLSDRRTRHFLAGIAPKLLEEIAATPDPDATLGRLAEVSDSLGGKAALWELFQSTPPTLRLCVRLCAASPYLTGILTSNPGMIDELIDSLILDRLPRSDHLEAHSRELCRQAEDIDPILQSFKNSAHLRIGVRDLLGRDSILDTHKALADTAEACVRRIAEHEWEYMANRYGDPIAENGARCRLTIVALGKLGGREPNYHSDMEVLFLYDADGHTRPRSGGRREGTTNNHFFSELVQRINKRMGHYGPSGPLYEMDAGIRFSHHRHVLAVSLTQFRESLQQSQLPLWQRLALVPARVIFGEEDARHEVDTIIAGALRGTHWQPALARETADLRFSRQSGAAAENLKRGRGGTLDVETIVQMLLLKHAAELDGKLGIGTLEGLEVLRREEWISIERARQLAASYKYMRGVESSLRLMNLPARHDLPQSTDQLRWLAFGMRETHANVVTQKCEAYREVNRRILEEIIMEETTGSTVGVSHDVVDSNPTDPSDP